MGRVCISKGRRCVSVYKFVVSRRKRMRRWMYKRMLTRMCKLMGWWLELYWLKAARDGFWVLFLGLSFYMPCGEPKIVAKARQLQIPLGHSARCKNSQKIGARKRARKYSYKLSLRKLSFVPRKADVSVRVARVKCHVAVFLPFGRCLFLLISS